MDAPAKDFHQEFRLAQAEEVADTVVYLASARASYISGTIVTVDGGRAVRNAT